MTALQIVLVFFHMCIVPYLIGTLFVQKGKDKDGCGAYVFLAGLMISYAGYEVLALGMQKLGKGFDALSAVYLTMELFLCACAIGLMIKGMRGDKKEKKTRFLKPDIYMILAFLLIGVQIAAILFMATPDMDDAFYSGLSSMSLANDYILEISAYDGRMVSAISKRYMVSALPVYQASLSRYSGMHHLVITHNFFPLFYMPLAYAVYYELGKRFLKEEGNEKAKGKFLFFFALLHMIGNYYVFSPENFLVTRMWQGKALFAALFIPALWIFGQRAMSAETEIARLEKVKRWSLVAATLLAAAFMGETGLFLGPFMLGCQSLAFVWMDKKVKLLIPAVLCVIPEVLLFVLYLI